jgi:hypothetical protein
MALQIIGDAIHFGGEPVARITVGTSTIRDRFEARITGAYLAEGLGDDAEFANNLMDKVREKAQAGAVTVAELDQLITKLLGAE